jgi:hypothetical protein
VKTAQFKKQGFFGVLRFSAAFVFPSENYETKAA